MAEESSGPRIIHPAEPLIVLIIGAAILGAIVMRFQEFLLGHSSFADFLATLWLFLQGKVSFTDVVAATGSGTLIFSVFILQFLAYLLSLLLVFGIFYAFNRFKEADKKMREPLYPPKEIFYGVEQPTDRYINPKWVKVLDHINSENSSDWRLAILEADIILNEMLEKIGYHGATMSEKLKSVEPSDFNTLQDAWEAHKVRNAIAHEGSDLVINKPEAERVIKLFKKVFEEFKYI